VLCEFRFGVDQEPLFGEIRGFSARHPKTLRMHHGKRHSIDSTSKGTQNRHSGPHLAHVAPRGAAHGQCRLRWRWRVRKPNAHAQCVSPDRYR
jgi:hypothetical protein